MLTTSLIGHVRSFAVAGVVLFVAWSWGSLLLRRHETIFSVLERLSLRLTLGLGAVGLSIFGLGILGQLSSGFIFVVLASPCAANVLALIRKHPLAQAPAEGHERLRLSKWSLAGAAAIGVIGLIALVTALAPPTRYDALMYHLVGPQIFLEQGRILASGSRWWLNLPATVEMLYLIALALDSETAPALIHLAFLGLCLLATYTVAARVGGASVARLAVVLLAGMPILAIWGSGPEVDFGWAVFEFESAACVLAHLEGRKGPWLPLAGVFAGMALGTKYLAALGFLAVLLLLGLDAARNHPRRMLSVLAKFVLPAIVVALPWYARNLFAFGDPVFPFLSGSRLDPERMQSFTWYASSLHGSRGLLDWLTLPVSLFLTPGRFSATAPLQSSPNPLFLLAPFALLAAPSRSMIRIGAFAGMRYLLWSITPSLSVRYLLPAFPWMAILVAFALVTFSPHERVARAVWKVFQALPGTVLAYSLIIVAGITLSTMPFKVVLGIETRESFLGRTITTFRAMEHATQALESGDRVLTTGDGRTYYFPSIALDNDDQFLWLRFVEDSTGGEAFVERMAAASATHLLVSRADLEFFLSVDSSGRVSRAVDRLESVILPRCGILLYEDPAARLYRMNCGVERSLRQTKGMGRLG